MKKKVAIPVSKTNYNRFKFRTHLLEKVLRLAGYRVFDDDSVACVENPVNKESVPLGEIELYPKKIAIVPKSKPKSVKVEPELKTTA